jgi:tRNA(Arg) A34 adenosine deaminase TadA
VLLEDVSKKTRRHLELARNIARQSHYGKIRHGAVLVKGSTIVNCSHNEDRHCAFGQRFRERNTGHATLHAELGCILGLDRSRTEGCTIYVVRINRKGKFRMSKPCDMCHEALKHCGVKKVVYTTNDGVDSYRL